MDAFDPVKLLQDSKQHREKEVAEYQFHIDHFNAALQVIDNLPPQEAEIHMEFRDNLVQLIKDNQREQNKSKIMLEALKLQLK